MCGIAGIISPNKQVIQQLILKRMANTLAHRGPDGSAVYINEEQTVGLAHTRLAVIDLSNAAAQPMHYLKRYSIVYNGEIYNYKALKNNLQSLGYQFFNDSDTEVILAAYHHYKQDCVTYFDGMFAFAIWDNKEEVLFTARDTFGEKPFYYILEDDVFLFASEMKALWAIGIDKTVDDKMMLNYLALGIVQNVTDKSQTFFKNILALPPAHYGIVDFKKMKFALTRFSNIEKENIVNFSEADAIEQFNYIFENTIKSRLQSDVPVGTSLSGGLDSSTIAYFVNKYQAKNFTSFSATFSGFENDEATFIKNYCEVFGIDNKTTSPSVDGLINDFEKICYHQEEPIASSSIYAQYKVYELAKNHNVKVLLDGQGADEILAGYSKYLRWYLQELVCNNKYAKALQIYQSFKKNGIIIPFGLKDIAAGFLPTHTSLALEKIALNKINADAFITNQLKNSIIINPWQVIYKPIITKLNDALYYDTMQHGLEELLRYADRNSMAHGVEVRLPFLNVALVSFIFSLPPHLKISNGFTKHILRKLMDSKIPDHIVWNPKKIGFETPQKQWMQNKKIQEMINEAKQKLVNNHILKPEIMNKKIMPMEVHQANNVDWRYLSLGAVL